MEIKDLLGFSKPLEKLIDVVSNAVGRLSKQYFDKKDIQTEVYRIKQFAVAQVEADIAVKKIVEESNSPTLIAAASENAKLEIRTQERLNYQESKRQLNIENVTAFAAKELINEQSVSEEPLNEDWTTRFFRIVEDVSNEEMQMLWGKILAGEIKQPNSFSLRTLEIVRNLSQKDAETFSKVANFAIRSGNDYFLFHGNDNNALSNKYGISYNDIALLIEVGLIQSGDFVQYQLQQNNEQTIFTSGNTIIVIEIKANIPTINLPINSFNKVGNELMKLIVQQPPLDYLNYIAKSIKIEDFVDVKYSEIISRNGNQIKYKTPLKDFE